MSVQDLIHKMIGASVVTYTNRVVTQIPATAGIIAEQDAGRVGLLVVNLGATDAYIGPFPEVSASKGIYVAAGGGSVRLIHTEDFDLPTQRWYGYSAVATNCLIIELVLGGK